MSVGSLFLKPNKLKRAIDTDSSSSLPEDILKFIGLLVLDQAQGGALGGALERSALAALDQIQQNASGGIEAARQKMEALVQPLVDGIQGLGDMLPASGDGADDVAGIVAALLELLSGAAASLEDFSIDQVRNLVTPILGIMQDDLGLTNTYLEERVLALIDDLARELESLPAEVDEEERKRASAAARIVRRIKRRARGRLTLPALNADDVSLALIRALRRMNVDQILEKVGETGGTMGRAVSAADSILNLVPFTGFGTNTIGAAQRDPDNGDGESEEQYRWYLSWLLGENYRHRSGGSIALDVISRILFTPFPADEIWAVGEDANMVRRYLFHREENLGTPPNYSYTLVSSDQMERAAFHLAHTADWIEMLLHAFSIEGGDFLSNLLLMLLTGTDAVFKLAARRPLYPWLTWPIRLLAPIVGSFPYMHTEAICKNRTIFWLTYYGARGLEAAMYHYAAQGVRNAILSMMTLLNHNSNTTEENVPENMNELTGLVQLITGPFIFLWAAVTPKDHYWLVDGNDPNADLLGLDWAVGSLAYSLSCAIVGTHLAAAFLRDYPAEIWTNLIWQQWWRCLIVSVIGYWPALFMLHENDTEDGHYGHNASRPWIQGYPPGSSSPYLLPFRDGPIQCAQGNRGIWSHNDVSFQFQIYAYDFAMDSGDEILASRPGTVVDYFDWAPNDEDITTSAASVTLPAGLASWTLTGQTVQQSWNFVCIRHDQFVPEHDPTVDDGAGNQVRATNAAGEPLFTYCVYGHGRNGSVRGAFGSDDPAAIIGQQVTQGQLIMLADDTGVSAYNHLHTQVHTGPAAPLVENVGTGDGVALSFNITLANLNVGPGTVRIFLNGTEAAADDGAGGFTGPNIDATGSTVNYLTGALTIAWTTDNPPANGVTISVGYNTDPPRGTGNLDGYTIPFVYRDAVHHDLYHAALDDGIPRSLKFYWSDNG